ncbi:MAG: protein phosphatase CheZ [Syntrophobacteraceae bacterium]|jgi:chemotaxis protein CheZ
MMPLETQDWNEMVKLLRDTEESLSAMSVGDGEQGKEKSRQSLMSFHTTASMFGLEDLAKAGIELEKFLTSSVSPSGVDSIAALGFAVSSLVDQMRNFHNGNGNCQIDLNEILEILGPSEMALPALGEDEMPAELRAESSGGIQTRPEAVEGSEENAGLNNLSELVRSWGGELSVSCDSPSECKFSLTFTGSAETLQKIESLLCSADPCQALCGSAEEVKLEKLLDKGREFMSAFSNGDIPHAQEVLLDLADQQSQPSVLYKEVGTLARGLHDSIRGFLNNLEPSLKDMVEDQLPDSGNRLEHMLEMTEKSAITTLDHVEAMQERLVGEMELISNLRALMAGLSAIGDSAEKKLVRGSEALDAMESIIGQHRSDLDIILTAQDYQDLSGQIILKITKLLNDMQGKLLNLIRTFGVKPDTNKQKTTDSLYGPAHAAVEDAVHCQDDVDSLLAEFGF